MSYQTDILEKLRESDNWPHVTRPEFLDELNDLADNAYNKKTIEGYLASLLIYHQITEDMTKVLIECSTFYLQLSIFPSELKNRDLNGKMYGQLIYELSQSVLDNDLKMFIQKCKDLNTLRIKMVHKITLKTSLNDISRQTKKVKNIFDEVYEIFDKVYDNYRVTFKDFKKNIEDMEETIA